jgi:hypothetical protein
MNSYPDKKIASSYHQQTVKRNDETHEFCTRENLSSIFYMLTYYYFYPQIDSECDLGPCVISVHLTDVILTFVQLYLYFRRYHDIIPSQLSSQ